MSIDESGFGVIGSGVIMRRQRHSLAVILGVYKPDNGLIQAKMQTRLYTDISGHYCAEQISKTTSATTSICCKNKVLTWNTAEGRL